MNKLFSLPVFIGIIAGLLFPYAGLSLVWITSSVLFLLLFFNVLGIEPKLLLSASVKRGWSFALVLVLLFVFFPVVQTAAASWLVSDRDSVFGLAMCGLSPIALVLPVFLRRTGGDVELGAALVIVSTLLCPLIVLPMLALMGITGPFLDAASLLPYFLLITAVPVALALAVTVLLPAARARLTSLAPAVSALLLGLLMFVLVGSAIDKVPVRSWRQGDVAAIVAIMVWMDFGVYFVMREVWSETAALALATRNFAIPGSLLLFFQPKAVLPAAIGLAVHAFYFQWLMVRRNIS